jgi:hypothetical protein
MELHHRLAGAFAPPLLQQRLADKDATTNKVSSVQFSVAEPSKAESRNAPANTGVFGGTPKIAGRRPALPREIPYTGQAAASLPVSAENGHFQNKKSQETNPFNHLRFAYRSRYLMGIIAWVFSFSTFQRQAGFFSSGGFC